MKMTVTYNPPHPMPTEKDIKLLLANNNIDDKLIKGYFVGKHRLKMLFVNDSRKALIVFAIQPDHNSVYSSKIDWTTLEICESTVLQFKTLDGGKYVKNKV